MKKFWLGKVEFGVKPILFLTNIKGSGLNFSAWIYSELIEGKYVSNLSLRYRPLRPTFIFPGIIYVTVQSSWLIFGNLLWRLQVCFMMLGSEKSQRQHSKS